MITAGHVELYLSYTKISGRLSPGGGGVGGGRVGGGSRGGDDGLPKETILPKCGTSDRCLQGRSPWSLGGAFLCIWGTLAPALLAIDRFERVCWQVAQHHCIKLPQHHGTTAPWRHSRKCGPRLGRRWGGVGRCPWACISPFVRSFSTFVRSAFSFVRRSFFGVFWGFFVRSFVRSFAPSVIRSF